MYDPRSQFCPRNHKAFALRSAAEGRPAFYKTLIVLREDKLYPDAYALVNTLAQFRVESQTEEDCVIYQVLPEDHIRLIEVLRTALGGRHYSEIPEDAWDAEIAKGKLSDDGYLIENFVTELERGTFEGALLHFQTYTSYA